MYDIHPTAIISETAKIAEQVSIGPYCIIGRDVELDKGVKLHSHVCIEGKTYIGAGTEIFPFASIGYLPQDLKYKGEKSELRIGTNNIIREYVTIHPGTAAGSMKTVIGNNCLFMVGSHIAHDCIIGNNVILANNATLGGHVTIGDYAILGGLAAVHQFVRIGAHAIIGGVSAVVKDIIPYGNAAGDRAKLLGINITGMKRRKFPRETINAARDAFRILFLTEQHTLEERLKITLQKHPHCDSISEIATFIRANGPRTICLATQSKEIIDNNEYGTDPISTKPTSS